MQPEHREQLGVSRCRLHQQTKPPKGLRMPYTGRQSPATADSHSQQEDRIASFHLPAEQPGPRLGNSMVVSLGALNAYISRAKCTFVTLGKQKIAIDILQSEDLSRSAPTPENELASVASAESESSHYQSQHGHPVGAYLDA